MAKENELQFAISLKNDASATLAQFKSDAESAMKAAGTATEKYGQTTQNLTGWIKEQKAEQRQHNFLFAQGKEIVQGSATVLALFNATMGDSSEGMKMLSNSMNAGYVAFQGVNNVVGLLGSSFSFLAGPWGLAISLAAGAAVAFSQYSAAASKSSEETKKLAAEANELDYRLGRVSEAARKAFLLSEIVAAQDKVDALKKTTTDWLMQIMSQGRYGTITKLVGTPEEIAEVLTRMRDQATKTAAKEDTLVKASTGIAGGSVGSAGTEAAAQDREIDRNAKAGVAGSPIGQQGVAPEAGIKPTAQADLPISQPQFENLVDKVIQQESGGDPNAVSPVGAKGLMQVMSHTGFDPGMGVEPMRDDSPEENVRFGRDYLAALLKRYDDVPTALAAYNWGLGNVDEWIAGGRKGELPEETQTYIRNIVGEER